jgi:hypothetical protein
MIYQQTQAYMTKKQKNMKSSKVTAIFVIGREDPYGCEALRLPHFL